MNYTYPLQSLIISFKGSDDTFSVAPPNILLMRNVRKARSRDTFLNGILLYTKNHGFISVDRVCISKSLAHPSNTYLFCAFSSFQLSCLSTISNYQQSAARGKGWWPRACQIIRERPIRDWLCHLPLADESNLLGCYACVEPEWRFASTIQLHFSIFVFRLSQIGELGTNRQFLHVQQQPSIR